MDYGILTAEDRYEWIKTMIGNMDRIPYWDLDYEQRLEALNILINGDYDEFKAELLEIINALRRFRFGDIIEED